jgi:N6-L-threonylcarbamoyladenine synthase
MVDTMVKRTLEAANIYDVKGVLLGGGVAANSQLREWMSDQSPVRVVVPRPGLCTDNAAMIGAAAFLRFKDNPDRMWDLDVIPNLRLG